MILFLNRFYRPSTTATGQLLTDLAEGLAARGHSVGVLASRHDASLPGREEINGVRIHRVGTPPRRKGFARILEFRAFHSAARRHLPAMLTPADTVVALTDPPLIGTMAAHACRMSGARLIHWTQDIYPELLAAAGPGRLTLPLIALLRPRRDQAWREASRCVVLGNDMAGHLLAHGVSPDHLAIIPNWAPAGLTPAPSNEAIAMRARWGIDAKFIVAYSGNMGRVHDLAPCVRVAEALHDDPRFGFIFVGEGARLPWLRRAVTSRNLKNVSFRPHESRARLAASLTAADAHWVTLREGCEHLVFPSKLYGITAVGRPVLFAGSSQCELAQLVRRDHLGIASGIHDTESFVAALRHWIEAPEVRAGIAQSTLDFTRKHSFGHALAAWEKILI